MAQYAKGGHTAPTICYDTLIALGESGIGFELDRSPLASEDGLTNVHVTGAVPCDTLAVVPFDRGKETRGVARAPRQPVVWCRCGEPPCGAP